MLILSMGKHVLYDTSCGKSISISPTTLNGMHVLIGADEFTLGVYKTRDDAKVALEKIAKECGAIILKEEE